jgi:Flp pilus assembly protein TadD
MKLSDGLKAHKDGNLNYAEKIYGEILEKDNGNSDVWHLMGLIAHQKGKSKEAIGHILKAISLDQRAMYYGNLGMIFDSLGDKERGEENFRKALEIDEKYGNAKLAYYNLGVYSRDRGELNEAIEYYNKAIVLNGEFGDARWNRSLILLLLGRFGEGWKDYEYRFKKDSPIDKREFGVEKWDGKDLRGKRILVLSEQGFGDNIQFVRYIRMVKDKGGYVILECKKGLEGLFEKIEGVDELIEKDSWKDIDFDCYIHLMSLPGVFKTNYDNIPNEVPYLFAKNNLVYDNKFESKKFKIGIVWEGNKNQANNENRSTNLNKFKLLNDVKGVELYSLQVGSDELIEGVIDLKNRMRDFSDTAGIIANMDLIISVDTAVAHLAGAMGKNTWVLLSKMPDWRWFLDREDSLWYPSMKLFRQKEKGDWDGVFENIKKELIELVRVSSSYRTF